MLPVEIQHAFKKIKNCPSRANFRDFELAKTAWQPRLRAWMQRYIGIRSEQAQKVGRMREQETYGGCRRPILNRFVAK